VAISPGESGLSTATEQIEDQHYDSDDQQEVDQASSYVEAEAEKPQNQENHENCPKHLVSPWPDRTEIRIRALDGRHDSSLIPDAQGRTVLTHCCISG
jgi:hypothetical protein